MYHALESIEMARGIHPFFSSRIFREDVSIAPGKTSGLLRESYPPSITRYDASAAQVPAFPFFLVSIS